jgi:hypothetical protein
VPGWIGHRGGLGQRVEIAMTDYALTPSLRRLSSALVSLDPDLRTQRGCRQRTSLSSRMRPATIAPVCNVCGCDARRHTCSSQPLDWPSSSACGGSGSEPQPQLFLLLVATGTGALVKDILVQVGESTKGGMGHACETETSLQLSRADGPGRPGDARAPADVVFVHRFS